MARPPNAPWTDVELQRMLRLVDEGGVGDWDVKAKQFHQEALQHRAEHGGPAPPRRSAKSIEGKWYKKVREQTAAEEAATHRASGAAAAATTAAAAAGERPVNNELRALLAEQQRQHAQQQLLQRQQDEQDARRLEQQQQQQLEAAGDNGSGSEAAAGSAAEADEAKRPYVGLDPEAEWETLWAALAERGWRSVPGKRQRNDFCFLPPGISHAGPPFRSRVDYYDSFRSGERAEPMAGLCPKPVLAKHRGFYFVSKKLKPKRRFSAAAVAVRDFVRRAQPPKKKAPRCSSSSTASGSDRRINSGGAVAAASASAASGERWPLRATSAREQQPAVAAAAASENGSAGGGRKRGRGGIGELQCRMLFV
jgi:hypothetical protein